ncbi:hypothetical protein [Microlunatus parietis]|uniref:Uncharacterized protein n=1 Tax=Microlunatus parietis TaxID=682979 RepID=A0A7Y9I9M8_9ACTN|nr:hypothetical protein [Microlunatus parietis]NYE72640.1 hypothetical protein [Microlunatus parietis]
MGRHHRLQYPRFDRRAEEKLGRDNENFSDGVLPLGPDTALDLRGHLVRRGPVTTAATNRLRIETPAGARVFARLPERGQVAIDYRTP